jgi:hypothetical protein
VLQTFGLTIKPYADILLSVGLPTERKKRCKKMMKKIGALLLVVMMAFAMTACKKEEPAKPTEAPEANQTVEEAPAEDNAEAEAPAEDAADAEVKEDSAK